jgi:hypothetical protein
VFRVNPGGFLICFQCRFAHHSHFGDLGEQSDKDECAERVIGMPDAAMFSGGGDFFESRTQDG